MDRPFGRQTDLWSTDRPRFDRQTLGRRTDAVYGQTFERRTDVVYGQTFGRQTDAVYGQTFGRRTDAVYGQTFGRRTDRGTPNSIDHRSPPKLTKVHQEVDLTIAMAELAMASRP
jgi:hypothetical protein